MFREGTVVESGSADEVSRLQRRVATWRRTRPRRTRMPEVLWESAVGLARVRGVHRVARALRLDYYSLKRRVSATGAGRAVQPFVEVSVAPVVGGGPVVAAAVVEIERRGGERMRLQSVTPAGVAAVCEAFWRTRERA